MSQHDDSDRSLSRRSLLQYSGLAAAAVAGSSVVTACGSDSGDGGSGGSGGRLIHGATGGSSKDTLDAHAPGDQPRHRARQQPLRAAALLGQRLRHRPGPGRVGRALGRRADLDDQRSARASPSTTARTSPPRTCSVTINRVADPKAPTSAGVALAPDHRPRRAPRRSTTRRSRSSSRRRTPCSTTCWRSTPSASSRTDYDPKNPGRHRRLQVQVVHPRQGQRLHQVRRLLGRQGHRRRAAHPGLRRPQRPGQRPPGGPDPDDRQPALQPDRHPQGAGRQDPRVRHRRVGAVHDAGRRQAVLRRPGAPGHAADLRPPADDRPGAQRLRHRWATTSTPRSTRPSPRTCRSASRTSTRPSRCSSRPARRASRSSCSPATTSARWPRRRAALFVEQAKKAGVDVKVVKKNPFYGDDYLSYPFAPGLLEHPQLPAAGRGLRAQGRHLQRDALRQREVRRPDRGGPEGDRRGQAHHAAPGRPGDRVQRGRLHHLGLPRARSTATPARSPGIKPSRYLPLGSYKFQTASVSA